jgi:glycosyltransferase involved in cell wall biosynthesis
MASFTIGIPVRNGERYLRQAITSAVSQKRPADEILIIDDASTDSTSQIIHSMELKANIRTMYNNNPTGYADAFMRIARYAKGDYVVFLSCDDLLADDFLLHVEKAMEKYPASRHVYSGCYYIDENGIRKGASPEPHSPEPVLFPGKIYSQNYLRSVFQGNNIHRFLGFAIERNLLLNECPIRKEAGLIMDDDMFVRVGAFTDVVGISQPLVSVRIHSMSEAGKLESLSLKLAEDYLFQTKNYASHSTHLDPEDILLYHKLNSRFVDSLFLEGVRKGRGDWVERAICLREEFDTYVPGFMNGELSGWRKILWSIARKDRGSNVVFKIYNTFRPMMKKTKKLMTSLN